MGFKHLPRWLWIAASALVLLIALGLIVPYFLDVDRYRTAVAVAIEGQTGRKVSLGKIRARLLPHIGFVVEDFRLGNPPGFAPGDTVTAEAIRGNLALLPLLGGEYRLSSVELVRPKLFLVEDERGQTNYSQTTPSNVARAPTTAAGGQSLAIDEIDLSNAEVTVGQVAGHHPTVVPSLRVRGINVELTHVVLSPMRPKDWRGAAKLSGVELELPGWNEPIRFRSGQVTLRDGRIDSEFRLEMAKAADWKGHLQVADVERGVAIFDLTTTQLDVDQLLAAQTPAKAPPAPARARPQHSELVAQGRLSADRLRWQPYTANHGAAEIRIFSDRMELWPVTVELYTGTLQLSARTDRTQNPVRFSANVQLRNLDVGKMLSVASPGLRGRMAGIGEMELQLFGSLGSTWERTLAGAGRFAIRDGRLPGVEFSGLMGSVAKATGVGGETPFRSIEGDLNVGQGRISSRAIHMDSPRGAVDLHGSTGLDGSLAYDGQAVLTSASVVSGDGGSVTGAIADVLGGVLQRNVSRVTVPFTIRGTLESPQVRPSSAMPSYETPASGTKSQPQKKSILDLFRKP